MNIYGMSREKLENYFLSINEKKFKAIQIYEWLYDKKVNELSGGQLQLLNLASVMVMDPDILILDEPSAQLDPVAASEFFSTLKKLNRDFALTVVIAEHRLEELIPVCDHLIVMENGRIIHDAAPDKVVGRIFENDPMFDAMPAPYRLFRKFDRDGNAFPLSIREGRSFISEFISNTLNKENLSSKSRTEPEKQAVFKTGAESEKGTMHETGSSVPALEFKDVYFR